MPSPLLQYLVGPVGMLATFKGKGSFALYEYAESRNVNLATKTVVSIPLFHSFRIMRKWANMLRQSRQYVLSTFYDMFHIRDFTRV